MEHISRPIPDDVKQMVQSKRPPPGDGQPPGSPLTSPSIGTAQNDLIAPCSRPGARPSRPAPPPQDPAIALALSGGGFRATLAALGVIRFLADAGLLGHVRYVSSVSGGSVANGLLACRYEMLQRTGFSREAVDDQVVAPFLDRITSRSLSLALLRNAWRIIGPRTRTDLLARMFDRWFFDGRALEDLSPDVRFIFNAASVTTGVRFAFERDVLGDWVVGRVATKGTGLRVAQAAAASAAVPGAFAPLALRKLQFPCSDGRTVKLVDGGAYDNSGLEAIDDLSGELIVAVNAGGLFRTGAYGGVPIVRDLQRASSLLYRQSTALRRREMVARFKVWEEARKSGEPAPPWGRRGVLFGLATTFQEPPSPEWTETRPEHPEMIAELAGYKTSFARFPGEVCRRLLYRGWWLTGATLATYHREVLPEELPSYGEPV
jgi:NTE family protein